MIAIERIRNAGDKMRELLGKGVVTWEETNDAFDEWEAALDAWDDEQLKALTSSKQAQTSSTDDQS